MTWEFFKKFILIAKKGSVIRQIAWLTIGALILSFSAFLIVMSVMTALNRNQQQRILSVEPHISIEIPSIRSISLLKVTPLVNKIELEKDLTSSLYETQDVILRTMEGRFRGAVARGLQWESLKRILGDSKGELEHPQEGDVFLGSDLADLLGVFEGDSITVIAPEGLLLPPSEAPRVEKVRVRKIISTRLSDIDVKYMFYVQGEALTGLRDSASRRLGLEVWLPNIKEVDRYKNEWSQFPGTHIETWKDRNSALFFALKLEKLVIGFFLVLAGFVAGLSLISVMTLLVSQKKKEIGLLQAIGFSKMGVRWLFFKIGLLLSSCGIGAGLLFGAGVSFYLQFYPLKILPDIYYDAEIPAHVEPFYVILAVTGGALFAAASSWWVSLFVVKVSPSQALRA